MAATNGEVSRVRIIKLIVRPCSSLKDTATIEDAGTLSCTTTRLRSCEGERK